MECDGSGVRIYQTWQNLRNYIGKDKFVEYIAYRKVNYKLTVKASCDLRIFQNEVKGMPYSLAVGKLMVKISNKQTMVIPKDDKNKMVSADRTFFCSELVAKAFKVLGIIENDSSSCANYYPKHFSKKGDKLLKLTKDTSIDEE
jgi:hypothetical protein